MEKKIQGLGRELGALKKKYKQVIIISFMQ